MQADKADYAADDMVMITGSGWQPGETVTLEIVEDPIIHDPDTLYAVADADGNISNEYIIHGHDVVQTFTLTASGMTSGSVSQTTFTNSLNSTSTASLPTTPTTDPTVMTDKQDYVPGETVLITGSGWEPGETVALELVETPLIHPAEMLYAIADDAGNITNAEYVIQDHDLGQSFTLTATGLSSGLTAQTTFTDAVCNNNNNCQPSQSEQCDDGNVIDGDGCSSTCTIEPGYVCTACSGHSTCTLACGSGTVDSGEGEQCDDGVNNGTAGSC